MDLIEGFPHFYLIYINFFFHVCTEVEGVVVLKAENVIIHRNILDFKTKLIFWDLLGSLFFKIIG
jgi:hypothetical protein